ncbi:hypothetical protein GOD54_23680 [Sinorhizobium medicae]|nr:hypothetical protein [Sinorhizobium medicae]
MALKDIQIPKVDVEVTPGSSFAVRGLSTADIEHLVRLHGTALRELFTQYMSGDRKKIKATEMLPILKDVVSKVPALVVDVIALGADADEDDIKVLKKLSSGVQLNALSKIAGMTLNVEGDLGNVLETVIQLLGKVNTGMDGALLALSS